VRDVLESFVGDIGTVDTQPLEILPTGNVSERRVGNLLGEKECKLPDPPKVLELLHADIGDMRS
jgi:hypothetical protein